MMPYLVSFIASFVFVGLKAAQQLNVVHHKVWWVVPVSFAMAVCEVAVVANMAKFGWGWIVLPVGLGSGLGCLAAMAIHRALRRAKDGAGMVVRGM